MAMIGEVKTINLDAHASATTAGTAAFVGDLKNMEATVGSYSAAGTLSGTWQIQGSLDNLNWVTIASASGSTAAANGFINISSSIAAVAYLRSYCLSYTSGVPQIVVMGDKKTS